MTRKRRESHYVILAQVIIVITFGSKIQKNNVRGEGNIFPFDSLVDSLRD